MLHDTPRFMRLRYDIVYYAEIFTLLHLLRIVLHDASCASAILIYTELL